METAVLMASKICALPGARISKPPRTYTHICVAQICCNATRMWHAKAAGMRVCEQAQILSADSAAERWGAVLLLWQTCMCLAAGQQQRMSTQTKAWCMVHRLLAYSIQQQQQQQQACIKATPLMLLRFHFDFLQISIKSKIFTFRKAHFSRANPPDLSAGTPYIYLPRTHFSHPLSSGESAVHSLLVFSVVF